MSSMVLRLSTSKIVFSDPDLGPKWPLTSRHSFNIGPMGKLFKSSPLKPISQFKANMAWMVLGQYTFKIVSGDHDLHPRWLP